MAKHNKSIEKRIKITKNGKQVITGTGLNHFLGKKAGHTQMRKKRMRLVNKTLREAIVTYLIH